MRIVALILINGGGYVHFNQWLHKTYYYFDPIKKAE
jgi:ABC-type maltose transport system permease subunit